MRIRTSTLVALPLLLAFGVFTTADAQEREEGHDDHAAHAEAHADGGMTVALEPVGDSGISGEALITHPEEAEAAEAHQVEIRLTGVEGDAALPAHVHQGSCVDGGPVVTALSSVEARDGEATSTTVVTAEDIAPAMEMARGGDEAEEKTDEAAPYEQARGEAAAGMPEGREHPSLFIQVHAANGSPVACGDIPMGKKADKEKTDGEM